MSKAPSKSRGNAAGKDTLQRIRVRADGYDASGAYWGTGPDVFIATSADRNSEVTVRANTVAEARTKIEAEKSRAAGVPRARDAIGGRAPSKAFYEIDWQDAAGGATVRVRITHSRDYLGQGQDHIEVQSLAPPKAPLPITGTGYRSHFISPLELINGGGPVTFVTAWLDREAQSKTWRTAVTKRAQGDLFQWAEAQVAVTGQPTKPAPKAKPARQSERPAKTVKRPNPRRMPKGPA